MKRIVIAVVIGFVSIAFLNIAAFAVTNSLPLRAGNSESITCPNALTNSNVKAKSETVNCGRSTPPTTTQPPGTTTTTTQPPGTTTTTTQPPSGGNCTNPTYTSSDPEGTDNTDPSDGSQFYWVNNDAWNGSHGPQTISVCNQSSWNVTATEPNVGGAVETYPDTEYDVGGRDNPSTTPISGWGAITSTFAEAYPSAGAWDAAYDLWLNNWTTEIMMWNQWAGAQSYWPNLAISSGKSLTLDGVPYHFYNNGGELMFFRGTQVSSGSVDILAALQWLVTNGYVKSTDVPTQLEYGVEICSTVGAETFPTTGLTFSLTP